MAFIGVQPASVPLTASDIEADIINSTHIGDTAISGFTALAEAPADTDEFLISDGGTLKRIDASFVGGGGLEQADMWNFSNNQSISANTETTITGNWGQYTTNGSAGGELGGSLTESSGIFSFPTTGIYYVKGVFRIYRDGDSRYNNLLLKHTANNSSYTNVVYGSSFIKDVSGGNVTNQVTAEAILDIESTTNNKIKFTMQSDQAITINGGGDSMTYLIAMKIGDT